LQKCFKLCKPVTKMSEIEIHFCTGLEGAMQNGGKDLYWF
jgi:hypothetical protein